MAGSRDQLRKLGRLPRSLLPRRRPFCPHPPPFLQTHIAHPTPPAALALARSCTESLAIPELPKLWSFPQRVPLQNQLVQECLLKLWAREVWAGVCDGQEAPIPRVLVRGVTLLLPTPLCPLCIPVWGCLASGWSQNDVFCLYVPQTFRDMSSDVSEPSPPHCHLSSLSREQDWGVGDTDQGTQDKSRCVHTQAY